MFLRSRKNLHTCKLPLAGSRSPIVKYARGSHIGFAFPLYKPDTFVHASNAQVRCVHYLHIYNYGKYINRFRPNMIKAIRQYEQINKKICRQKISIMFNEICINEEMLPIYIHIYIYIYIYMYINHHHLVVPSARISPILSRYPSLSFIAFNRSSGLQPVSIQSRQIILLPIDFFVVVFCTFKNSTDSQNLCGRGSISPEAILVLPKHVVNFGFYAVT